MEKFSKKQNLSNFKTTLSYVLFQMPENKYQIDNATSAKELLKVCEKIIDNNINNITDKKKAVELLTNLNFKKDYVSALTYLYNFYLKGDNLEVLSI